MAVRFAAAILGAFCAAALASSTPPPASGPRDQGYEQETVLREAERFFGGASEGLARVIEKAFRDHGRPNAYIRGEEASGAITVGLRYGKGTLVMKGGGSRTVYWQGPSIGFDLGGNVAKVFVLVYRLPTADAIYRRFPAVDGSFYYVGGVSINYQERDRIVLAPIRVGVGLRAGASLGYVHYTRRQTYNPF